jgi:hypothetical protein
MEKPTTPEAWDDIFPGMAEKRAEQEEKGLLFAQRYLVFAGPTSDARARQLLEHWTTTVRRRTLPPSASHAEHAAHNAFREFVEAIHAQIEFAMNGLNQPRPKT